MLNIIKSDLYRLVKSKGFYISLIIVMIMSALSIIGMFAGRIGISAGMSAEDTANSKIFTEEAKTNVRSMEQIEELNRASSIKEGRQVMKKYGGFKLDKEIIGVNINLYYVFIVFVVIILTKDFSNKSIKNTLSSAVSRRKYYFSKLALILGIVTLTVAFNTYFTYFVNIAVNGKEFASSIAEITKATLYQLPLIYGITCILVCIAFVTRKTSSFNALSISFVMMFQIILITLIAIFKTKIQWMNNYELQNALTFLCNNPTNSYIMKCAALGLAYAVISTIIGYVIFKKAEIK